MSEHQPPSGMPEYLEPGGGSAIPPEPSSPVEAPGGRRGHRSWWIGGGVVALLGLGAGAWAALSFFLTRELREPGHAVSTAEAGAPKPRPDGTIRET